MTAVAPSPRELLSELFARIDKHAEEVNRLDQTLRVIRRLPNIEGDGSDTVVMSKDPTPPDIPWPVRTLPADPELDAETRRLAAIGRAVSGVAHDFNNLLSVIQGYAELLAEQSPPGSFPREAADTIAATSETAAGVARHLLAVAKPEPGSPNRTDVNLTLNRLGRVLKAIVGGRISLYLDTGDNVPFAALHPADFTQVLLNLVTNAHEAMPEGGTLTIRSATTYGRVLLTVQDTGFGMDVETRNHMFDPYFSTKLNGKGIGLATVWHTVTEIGGRIGVESSPGCGTTVRIELPRA